MTEQHRADFAPPASLEAELAAARAEIGRLGADLLQSHADVDVQRFERQRLEGVLRAVRAWRVSKGNKDSAYFAALDTILDDNGGAAKPTAPVERAPAQTEARAVATAVERVTAMPGLVARAWCADCKTVHAAGAHTRPKPLPVRSADEED